MQLHSISHIERKETAFEIGRGLLLDEPIILASQKTKFPGRFLELSKKYYPADEINKIMGAQKLQRPDATIYYEKNLATVSPDSEIAIAEIASQLYNNPEYKLEIIGYCDNSGNAEYNQKLSLSRAEAIKRILVKQYNIEENRITTSGKGKTKGPKDNFIVNRRADIFIIK